MSDVSELCGFHQACSVALICSWQLAAGSWLAQTPKSERVRVPIVCADPVECILHLWSRARLSIARDERCAGVCQPVIAHETRRDLTTEHD